MIGNMKKTIISSLILALLISLYIPAAHAEEADTVYFYVSQNTQKHGDGSEENPFNTLQEAQNAVRNSSYRGKKDIKVIFRGGEYEVDKAFEFNQRDSGSEEHKVTYEAYEGEKVVFTGSKKITSDMFEAVPADILNRLDESVRDKVVKIDLRKLGVSEMTGEQQDAYNKQLVSSHYYLFADDQKLTQARYPNSGYVTTTKTVRNGDLKTTPVFQYDDERMKKWKNPEDIWIYSLWPYGYSPMKNNIESIDLSTNTIYCSLPQLLPGSTGGSFFFYNVLEELDMPGEYYMDHDECVIYLYPPESFLGDDDAYYMAYLNDNVFRFNNTSNFELKGITVQGSRKTGIYADGCKNFTINKCDVRYMTNRGIEVLNGEYNTVKNCDIHNIGYEGVIITAGSIQYLVDGQGLVTNNHIYKFGCTDVNYTGAVEYIGKGITVSHNLIHDSWGMAMNFQGVDCTVEYNEIYDVATETDDSAAIYDYALMYSRNNVFRYNLIYNHQKRKAISHTGTFAMYWDGAGAGKEVYGNIFYNMNRGVFINCGGFNSIENNVFIDVDSPIRVGPNVNTSPSYGMWFEMTKENPYQFTKGVWKEEYPIISDDFYKGNEGRNFYQQFRENYIGDNIYYKCGASEIDLTPYKDNKNYGRPDIIVEDDIFESIKDLDFRIKDGMCPENFDNIIDADKIGLLDGDA